MQNLNALFFDNEIITTSVIAWFIAQLLKVLFVLIGQKKIDFSRFVGSGGMPSSHSAFVVSLTTAIGKNVGPNSVEFAIAFAVAMVVMYDASGVRRAAGQQARILNKLVEQWGKKDPHFVEDQLKELLGHTPFEVLVGALLGIAIGLAR
ncbi:divergent PAP2 family protein [Petroclostridium sp. X23]|uniref:divergent PAP2 family protein n=1 Tax=Petroclostridium sp. X23 TaxID=3045146 RepID=UPI0024AE6AD5|nr:divergent PAP2 family protein [Petroclostridium sp. X23]WHH59635.1 divergent PAP2 family protein [Petroclostridium sp. X23]